MASWSAKRKSVYTTIIMVVFAIVVGLPTFFAFYKAPTCFDGKKNQDEKGVDCDGKCVKLCDADFASPVYVWERFSKVVNGVYNVIAYIENPNIGSEAISVPYSFRLYDNQGILISERKGKTSIPSGRDFVVFEPSVSVGERIPAKVTFEFTKTPEWRPSSLDLKINVSRISSDELSGFFRVEAFVTNTMQDAVDNIEAVAVIYNLEGNAIAFSRTYIEKLLPDSPYEVTFTWPGKFADSVSKIDILTRKEFSK